MDEWVIIKRFHLNKKIGCKFINRVPLDNKPD